MLRHRVRFKKSSTRKYVMLTAYDAPTASILEAAKVDMILVGDSLAMVVLGYPNTLSVTMDEMIHHAKAVRRGAPNSFIIGDIPLLGIMGGVKQALHSSKRFLKEGGCDAVKIEWADGRDHLVRELVRAGIPVMGHVGLTPQQVARKEDFKVRGRSAAQALEILWQAQALESAGAFSVLLECVPAPVAEVITRRLRKVPTIGIGAGPACDGQVLVFHDMAGLYRNFTPKFVRRYAQTGQMLERAVRRYSDEVRRGAFPSGKHVFGMLAEELRAFRNAEREMVRSRCPP